MLKKRSPIFHKVSNLLKISIFIAKMRKPVIPRLISLKKYSSKLKKHYNYGYIKEYQFSPSNSTPLIHYHRKPPKKRSYKDIYSILFICKCLGRLKGEGGDRNYYLGSSLEEWPVIEDAGTRELWETLDSGAGDDSIDERAERFIEKFYNEMRMQRQESLVQQM